MSNSSQIAWNAAFVRCDALFSAPSQVRSRCLHHKIFEWRGAGAVVAVVAAAAVATVAAVAAVA